MEIDKKEHWRLRLIELIGHLQVSQREVADKTGLDPTYVSRLLYGPTKTGRKNLGLESMAAIKAAYSLSAGWFDLPLRSELPDPTKEAHGATNVVAVREPIKAWDNPDWPFTGVRQDQYYLLTPEERAHIENDIKLRIKSREPPAKQSAPAPTKANGTK